MYIAKVTKLKQENAAAVNVGGGKGEEKNLLKKHANYTRF